VGDEMHFAIALAVGVPVIWLFGIAGRRLKLVDRPGDLKIHGAAIAITGGLGVVAAGMTTVAVTGDLPPGAVVGAVLLALAVGLLDDIRPLGPLLRIVILGAAGALLAGAGLGLDQFGPLAAFATILLMLACTNAVNLIDGQDGLAGGLTAIAALGLAGLAGDNSAWVGPLSLATAGALTGFLVWNRSPARIFLGNNGAYAVGALLAALIAGGASDGRWKSLLSVFLVVGVFAFEFIATVLRRLVNGGSLTGGDRDHSYDLLSERMGSRGRVTLLYLAAGVLLAVLGVFASKASLVVLMGISLGSACLAAALGINLWRGRPKKIPAVRNANEVIPSRSAH
jgi:UDP-GlcNAc:undecaprenyl-phosphate GlcNAc-1-phosphate transferase